MNTIGYARVSSVGQSLDVQLQKLDFCDTIFKEKKSGKIDNREQLTLCLNSLQSGDVLVITKLDRISRSTRHLWNIVNILEVKGVQLRVLDQNIDTGTPTGKLMFSMLGAIAEFENDLRRERQMDGIAVAKAKGIQFGRKRSLTDDQISEMKVLRSEGVEIDELMVRYGMSKASVYRALAPTVH
jgi:DNA invertase Pin-like site-specific DNA recombinase